MDILDILNLIFRWLHLVPAIIMVGGVFFMRFCLVQTEGNELSWLDTHDALRRKWMMLVMISTLLLLTSGMYNAAIKAMGFHLDMVYNGLLLVKILLALAVFYLSAVLAGRSERAKKMRQREVVWLNVLVVLMLLIVFIAGYMKISSTGFDKKVKEVTAITESYQPL